MWPMLDEGGITANAHICIRKYVFIKIITVTCNKNKHTSKIPNFKLADSVSFYVSATGPVRAENSNCFFIK